jgi:hypothetical protein
MALFSNRNLKYVFITTNDFDGTKQYECKDKEDAIRHYENLKKLLKSLPGGPKYELSIVAKDESGRIVKTVKREKL